MNQDFRVPPQDLEAEQSVLGAMMLDPDAIFTATQILKAEHFYREAHRHLFRSIRELFDRSEAVDVITLSNDLKKKGTFSDIGGTSALMALLERVPTAANIEHYANIVYEKFLLRNLISVSTNIVSRAYEDSEDVDELLDQAANSMLSVAQENIFTDLLCDMSSLTLDVHTAISKARSGERTPHIRSGFRDFDDKFMGWERGALTVIMAPPKVGKSHLMINSMSRSAEIFKQYMKPEDESRRIAYIILDMTRKTVVLRLLSQRLHITLNEIYNPSTDMLAISNGLHEINHLPIKICGEENVGHDLKRILRWMNYAKKFFGTELFFVDSFSKIEIKPERGQTDESYTSNMINQLQTAAKTLDVAVVGTVDLNYEGQAKGSSRWGFGPDNVFKLALSDSEQVLMMESKYLRNSAAGKMSFTANYRWSEVRDYESSR
jgi:replicative DNA helicase